MKLHRFASKPVQFTQLLVFVSNFIIFQIYVTQNLVFFVAWIISAWIELMIKINYNMQSLIHLFPFFFKHIFFLQITFFRSRTSWFFFVFLRWTNKTFSYFYGAKCYGAFKIHLTCWSFLYFNFRNPFQRICEHNCSYNYLNF